MCLIAVVSSLFADNRSINIYTHTNTDIVLLINHDSTFLLYGYGGSTNQSADCIIKVTGVHHSGIFDGWLCDVQSDISQYKVKLKEKITFKAKRSNDTLIIFPIETISICGMNTAFERKYLLVRNENAIDNKAKSLRDVVLKFPGNDTIVTAIASLTERPDQLKTCYTILSQNTNDSVGIALAKQLIFEEYWLKQPINQSTVAMYNDVAFFLLKNGKANLSKLILEQVLNAVPTRTPAYLNLADAYKDLGNMVEAIKNYQLYIELMKSEGKSAKIPKRVLDAVR